MKTNLETMVGYLSGRRDGPADPIRRDLADPASEASLFLEALRERSRAMFADGPPAGRLGIARHERPGRPRLRRVLPALGAAALILVAVGLGWWDHVAQVRRFEAALARRDDQWKARLGRIELALAPRPTAPALPAPRPAPTPAPAPADRSSELLLARLEDGLARLDQRLKETDGPRAEPEAPPADDQVRREVEGLKRDLADRDKSLRQDLWEMRTALQGVVIVVRQMQAQSGMGTSLPMPIPYAVPFPAQGGNAGNGQGPGAMPSAAPGAGHAGGHPGHRMPGGHP